MTDRSMLVVFPVARWVGTDPADIAATMLIAEACGGMGERGAVLNRALRDVRARIDPMRLPAHVRREAVGEWLFSVFAAEDYMRRNQGRTG